MGGSKGSSYSERPLTEEEKGLYSQQTKSLEEATEIAAEQFNLSREDRDYISRIYRGDLDPNDPRVIQEVQNRLANTPPPVEPDRNDNAFYIITTDDSGGRSKTIREFNQKAYDSAMRDYRESLSEHNTLKESITRRVASDLGGDSIDKLLFDAVKESGGKAAQAISSWETEAKRLGSEYTNTLTGISDSFKQQLTGASQKMGTADTDIYSQTKAQNLAGISQSYQEALKQAQGALSRRGLAGSGIEAGVISSLTGQAAMAQSGAMSQSYQQAIALSDQRRQQQLGIAGQVAQLGQSTAGQVYGIQSGLSNQFNQANLNAQQQQLANYQMASGVSQGVFGMSQNYLAQAGGTSQGNAQIAGQSAGTLGGLQMQYYNSQQEVAGAQAGAITSGITGMGAAGIIAMSDERLKTNIKLVDIINGHNIYTWDWIEGHNYGYNKGVLAQEVLEKNPDAVLLGDDGYYMVDYSKLGVL